MSAFRKTKRAVLLLAVLALLEACQQAYPAYCGYRPGLDRVVCN